MQSHKLTAMETMVAGVAHEVNTPLTGILIQTQLLLAQEFDEETMRCLQMILAETQRIAKIVQDCLAAVRHKRLEKEPTNINEILERVIKLSAYDLRVHNIEVVKELEPELPGTIADVGQIEQVFLNLIINAEQAMTGSSGRGRLRVLTRHVDGSIRVSISDNGPGIPGHDLGRIFDPFFTTKESGKGTGLGLGICQRIVARHGGKIWAESEYGKGSTFNVELPVLKQSARDRNYQPKEVEKLPRSPATILIIDDDEVVRRLLSVTLSGLGYSVDALGRARDALEQRNLASFDLLLVDIKMPEMTGIEFMQTLITRAPEVTDRVVFVTGDTITPATHEFLEMAGRPILTKPFDLKTLKSMVADTLQSKNTGPKAATSPPSPF